MIIRGNRNIEDELGIPDEPNVTFRETQQNVPQAEAEIAVNNAQEQNQVDDFPRHNNHKDFIKNILVAETSIHYFVNQMLF